MRLLHRLFTEIFHVKQTNSPPPPTTVAAMVQIARYCSAPFIHLPCDLHSMELSVFSVTRQILHTYQVWATFLGFLGDSRISTEKRLSSATYNAAEVPEITEEKHC